MIKVLLIVLLAIGAWAPVNSAQGAKGYTPMDGESPFPWGSESPFPWQTVDGLWRTTNAPLYFKFDVIRSFGSTSRYLRVKLLDHQGNLMAEGVGVTREKDQVIRARVIGKNLDAYALVRAYNRRKAGDMCGPNDCVMVVTLRDKDSVGGKDMHFLLQRVPLN